MQHPHSICPEKEDLSIVEKRLFCLNDTEEKNLEATFTKYIKKNIRKFAEKLGKIRDYC